MKNINWKDVLVRAGKTFVQTAVSYLIANLSGVNFSMVTRAKPSGSVLRCPLVQLACLLLGTVSSHLCSSR